MIISDDMYKRWFDLCPGALEAHRPEWGKRKTMAPKEEPEPENLASKASVQVDSFYGTLNTADTELLYPNLDQVALRWEPVHQPGQVQLSFSTFTPNFSGFRWRIDGGLWISGLDTCLCWPLHPGENVFEIQALNTAGHAGRLSILRLDYRAAPGSTWPKNLAVQEFDNGQARAGGEPFLWEEFHHPKLQLLRQKYQLDEIVASAVDDMDRVLKLRDWVKSRWDHEQPIISPPWDALYFLERTDKKIESFYCVHYSVTFMQCCLALGIPARLINLHRGICKAEKERGYGREMDEAEPCDEHVVNEVWIDDLQKWVMMDVDFDIHYAINGKPLSALEIHQALLEDRLDQVCVCEGPLAYKLKANERFYQYQLTIYYTHFCVFWRNNHLSDPSGPTRILHLIDTKTPPMLWWEGSDNRHRPQIIGPIGVSWPYTQSVSRLNDENLASYWASGEEPVEHWVELRWLEPVSFNQVVLDWALCWQRYWTSRSYRLEIWDGTGWQVIADAQDQPERAASRHSFGVVTTQALKIVQRTGGGSSEYPHRLWLAEVEVYCR